MLADFEGTLNAATIQCNVTSTQGTQITTQWQLRNFRGNPMDTSIINAPAGLFAFSGFYENRLTVLNLTDELDKVIVFCGTGLKPEGANFTLRIYRKCNYKHYLASTKMITVETHLIILMVYKRTSQLARQLHSEA